MPASVNQALIDDFFFFRVFFFAKIDKKLYLYRKENALLKVYVTDIFI